MAKSKRIAYLAELCKGYETVLDIGTDHGFVLKQAFDKHYIKHGIASDLREMPLRQAKDNLKGYPVTYRLSDGFLAIKEHFDLAIIAGMGAYLICDIMDHAPKREVTYLLQANEKTHILRDYLIRHGFEIIDEYLVFDRFYYIILKVKRGEMNLSEDDLYLGPILKSKQESKAYYAHKIAQIDKILPQADELRKDELKKMRQIYESVKLW
jgi:tRNA (adenine22-N1)-methyltransferase